MHCHGLWYDLGGCKPFILKIAILLNYAKAKIKFGMCWEMVKSQGSENDETWHDMTQQGNIIMTWQIQVQSGALHSVKWSTDHLYPPFWKSQAV